MEREGGRQGWRGGVGGGEERVEGVGDHIDKLTHHAWRTDSGAIT